MASRNTKMRKCLATGAVFLVASTAGAQASPLPASEWTPQVQLWLARAMVSEAGWDAELDYVAIAYVLLRRWHQMNQRWPALRFVDVVRGYCSGLGDYPRRLTARQRWIRGLSSDGEKPLHWPRNASWKLTYPFWKTALDVSEKWGRGELRDPCRGRAWHWGGTIDTPRGRMIAVNCGPTRNTFYGISSREKLLSVKDKPRKLAKGDNLAITEYTK